MPDTDLGAGNIAVSKTKPLSSQRLHANERQEWAGIVSLEFKEISAR